MEEELRDIPFPPRKNPYRFTRVPDYNDSEYDPTDPEAYMKAKYQRARESAVGVAELHLVGSELAMCYLRSGASHYRKCQGLVEEYMRRIKCPNFVCEEDFSGTVLNSKDPKINNIIQVEDPYTDTFSGVHGDKSKG